MKTACLINNYNYADFVHEAVDSALGQSVAFDEIVVVDDGSTDGSRELLARRYGRNPRVKIVTKRNEGQLSCFNEGLARSAAEVLFFLDADDVFEPNYLEQALDVYQRDAGIDFVFCGHRLFGQREGVELCFNEDRDLGYSVVLTAFLRPGSAHRLRVFRCDERRWKSSCRSRSSKNGARAPTIASSSGLR